MSQGRLSKKLKLIFRKSLIKNIKNKSLRKEIITEVGRRKVLLSVRQLSTITQSENVALVESAITTPKNNESSNITSKVNNIFTSSCIKMIETPGIDKVLLKLESSQGRVNESLITDNRALRKKKRKCKPMNLVNKMNKSMVENNMKPEEKMR